MDVIEAGKFVGAGDGAGHYEEHLRSSSLSVGTYSIPAGGRDDQVPHTEDEIYVVLAGEGDFTGGDKRAPVRPGTVLFVPAGEDHRFVDIRSDLAVLVLFAPPEGSQAGRSA